MNTIDKIRAEIERLGEIAKIVSYDKDYELALSHISSFLDTLQEPENPKGLQSLIKEASETAQRIIDRHSFYASLPENLRHKYTEGSWFEILDAISKYGKQEPKVDLEKEIDREWKKYGHDSSWKIMETIARHFYQFGLNSKQQ